MKRFVLLLTLLCHPCAWALEGPDRTALAALAAKARTVHSLSAEFTQTRTLSLFDRPLLSTGTFTLVKPDKLRFEFLSPTRSGFALDGGRVRRFSDRGAAEMDLDKDPVLRIVGERIIQWTSLDLPGIERDFTLERLRPPSAGGVSPQSSSIRLVPIKPELGRFIERIDIDFLVDPVAPKSVLLVEPGGDSLRMDFAKPSVNLPAHLAPFQP